MPQKPTESALESTNAEKGWHGLGLIKEGLKERLKMACKGKKKGKRK